MNYDLKKLKRIVLGDVVRASSGSFDNTATETDRKMAAFVDGIKFPTKPPIYRNPVVPNPLVPKPFKMPLLTKHR